MEGDAGLAALDQKLDTVLAQQEKMLQRFDEVMEELRIVKIRATVNR